MFLSEYEVSDDVDIIKCIIEIKMIHLIPGFTIEFFKGDTLLNRATIEPNSFSALAISTTFQTDMIELSSGVKFAYTGQLVPRVFNFCVFNHNGQQNTQLSPEKMSTESE